MSLPQHWSDIQRHVLDRGVWTRMHARMSARSRVTNLGVALLTCALIISLLFNTRSRKVYVPVVSNVQSAEERPAFNIHLRDSVPAYPGAQESPLTHLVIVAGHAIWKGDDPALIMNDTSWLLEDYQRGGSVKTFVKHIEEGLKIAVEDKSSLLVFSGGQTRRQSWKTEAESYYHLALTMSKGLPFFSDSQEDPSQSRLPFEPLDKSETARASRYMSTNEHFDLGRLRMTTEDYALDSFQNFLFSIARFYEFTGTYPQKITVVSYEFKKRRFVDLHAHALRWPSNKLIPGGTQRLNYVGIDDEPNSPSIPKLHDSAYDLFEVDMYGCYGRLLEKRRKRNSGRRIPPYSSTAPELAGLVDWCPAINSRLRGLYPGWLPWDPRASTGLGRGAQVILEQNGGKFVKAEYLPDGKRIV